MNIERLPEHVYAFTDAYDEHVRASIKPLPAGPRLMGVESKYVRADLHDAVVEERDRLRSAWAVAYRDHYGEGPEDAADLQQYIDRYKEH